MNTRQLYFDGIALVATAIVAAGCATADRGFNIAATKGCPSGPIRFGPSESACPGNPSPTDCVVVRHGNQVKFSLQDGGSTEFVVDFTLGKKGSPFEDGTLKAISRNGVIQKKTVSVLPADPVFPFDVKAPPGSNCPNVDPQIILN